MCGYGRELHWNVMSDDNFENAGFSFIDIVSGLTMDIILYWQR